MTASSNERLRSALGLAMKAAKAAKEGKALLAVLDTEASDNTKKHWSDITENAGIPLIFADGVGRAIGREAHMIACVTDRGFANMITAGLNENEQ